MKRICEFPLICGINKGVCCKDCDTECNHRCELEPIDCGNCPSYENMDEDDYVEPEFNLEAMFLFAKDDILIARMYKDLKGRNPEMSDENIMEVVFNGEVLLDSIMTEEYNKRLKIIKQ